MSSETTGVSALSRRYARALFELANEQKQLDEVASDLTSIKAMIDGSVDLQRLIQSPIIPREKQFIAIDAILETSGIGKMTRNFLGVVTQNRRLSTLLGIVKGYQTLLARLRGEVSAEIITAKPLTHSQLNAIQDSIKETLVNKLTINASVDESLLGGLVVKVGSRMIDTSLRTKLSQLELAMKGVG